MTTLGSTAAVDAARRHHRGPRGPVDEVPGRVPGQLLDLGERLGEGAKTRARIAV